MVYVHVRVRLKDPLDWVDGRIADGFVFRNGKITHYRSFADRPEALQWAEIEEHEIILSAPQRPPPLRSRLTRRDAAEARWAGQAATIQQMRPARLIAGLFGPVTK
ncbi:hypothetical protein TFLX_01573 [Thermoflexales bacterium]|nr:hypothetical protein TFLX_01573 [Thermoflexales bacterium]